ncbi:MAG: ribonuclease R [Psychrilyobacter sp.]|nr:ribonuclease R [Psychrilyobacter sp.]
MTITNEEKILSIFKKGKAKSISEITSYMGWSPKFKKDNRVILDKLVKDGELILSKRGKYNTPTNMGYITGTLDVIKDRFAFVDTSDFGVFIPKSKFNGAFNGDLVMVQLSSESTGAKKEGEVFKVLKREKNTIIGIYQSNERFGFVVPTHSFGKDIFVPKRFNGGAHNGELVVCEIVSWGEKDKKPEGKIVDRIGDPYDTNNMIEALIIREGLSMDFKPKLIKKAQELSDELTEEEIEKRHDLRHLPIITIDGDDAKDLDDAVYVEKLDNGNFKLIVCIADVSYYVPFGSALDIEARKRGNSVYLVDRVIPMFPREISNGLCSLNPHENKFVFTCEMEIDNKGQVVNHETYKAVISTAHRMTYGGVNKILAKDPEWTSEYQDINKMIFEMLELSLILRGLKHSRGSIDFDIPEVKAILGEDKKVQYLKVIDRGESERIIEDFMIAANETVAEKIFWMELPFLYRTHEKPDPDRIQALGESLKRFGYTLHLSEELHPGKFQKIIEQAKEDGNSQLVHKLILMSLKQARYTVDNIGHFGLASQYYAHFTSPIRRYADLMVHRVITETLTGYPNKKLMKQYKEEMGAIGSHISKTERTAMKLEQESVKIKIVEYMLEKIGEEYKARIIGFNKTKIFFETEEHVECFFDGVNSPNYFTFDEVNYSMTNEDTDETFKLGDIIDISVVRADLSALEVEVVPAQYLDQYRGPRKFRAR